MENRTENPAVVEFTQSTPASTWQISGADVLAFGGELRRVDALVATSKIANASNQAQFACPYVKGGQGPDDNRVDVFWPTPVSGKVNVTMRMDN